MTPDVSRRLVERPFFSVCIPQYNRTSFLIAACQSLDAQRFRDFEVCISDDCSTDGRAEELVEFLNASALSFVYRRRASNGRYDANLRSSIELAAGTYCFLLGNDDALKSADTLVHLRQVIERFPRPGVVITDFEEFSSGYVNHRVRGTALRGAGPRVAATAFRKFSFVGGVVLRTEAAHAAATTRWDGSEMYQMYVGCRIIAQGGGLVETDCVAVRKSIQIPGEGVDSYATTPRVPIQGIPAQTLPLGQIGRLVIDAIAPQAAPLSPAVQMTVLLQYLGLLYPYWLLEYRRVQSWRFAAGVARAMHPSVTLAGLTLPPQVRLGSLLLHGVATLVGLTAPQRFLTWLEPSARRVAVALRERHMRRFPVMSSRI